MNGKTLAKISLVGLSCLAVTASFIALSNHNVIRPVQSGSQNRTVVMNKNTIYQEYYYDNKGNRRTECAFFELEIPGSYTAIRDYCYESSTYFGNDHLFVCPIEDNGVGVRLDIDINGLGVSYHPNTGVEYYFDQAKTRRIYFPTFSNLTQIEFTFGEGNGIQFDAKKIREEYSATVEQDEEDANTYRIRNIASNVTFLPVIAFTTTQEQVDQHARLVVDQIIITYTC